MHNQRNRRAVMPKAPKAKATAAAPAFPPEIKIPPHRGAVSRSVEPPQVSGVALFAQPPATTIKSAAKRPKPAAQRRRAQRKAKVLGKVPPRGPKLASALPLPQTAEPLARNRSPVPLRSGGLLARINDWLGQSARGLWDRLGGVPTARPAPRRKRATAEQLELIRLRAENARLKRQLDTLATTKPPSPVREPVPQP